MFCLETFILDYREKKTWTENQQLFDGIIDVTLFDGVVGLDYYRFFLNWELGDWRRRKKEGTCKKLFDIHLYVVVEKLELCQLDFFQFLFFFISALFVVSCNIFTGCFHDNIGGTPCIWHFFFEWYQIWHFLSIAILDLSKSDIIHILTMGALLLTNMYLKIR